jgi:uncharacterized protein (TIGR03086 family)
MDLEVLYRGTVAAWNQQVAAVEDGDWDRPTPCSEWTVRELVNHVAGEDLWTVPLVNGSTIEEVGDRFDGDLLGDAPATVALDAAAAAVSAVVPRIPDGGTVHLSYGEERLEEYLMQLSADHLVHGWDLAVAVGARPQLDPDLVTGVAAWFAEREDLYRSAGIIGPRTGSSDDPLADLIAGFGRDPEWRRD